MQMKNKIKQETASMAVYVSIVLLTFFILLMGIYLTSTSEAKLQLKTMMKIKESYEKIIPEADSIYDEQLKKDLPETPST